MKAFSTNDQGAGSVLAIGLTGLVVMTTATVIPVALALAIKERTANAADLAALAAADTSSGYVAGQPCDIAEKVAALNGAELGSCALDGPNATVSARDQFLGFEITSSARAGPPMAEAQSNVASR